MCLIHHCFADLTFLLFCLKINRTVHLLNASWHYKSYSGPDEIRSAGCCKNVNSCTCSFSFLVWLQFACWCVAETDFESFMHFVCRNNLLEANVHIDNLLNTATVNDVKLSGHNKEHYFPVTRFSVYSVASHKTCSTAATEHKPSKRRRCNGLGLVKNLKQRQKKLVYEDKIVFKHALEQT